MTITVTGANIGDGQSHLNTMTEDRAEGKINSTDQCKEISNSANHSITVTIIMITTEMTTEISTTIDEEAEISMIIETDMTIGIMIISTDHKEGRYRIFINFFYQYFK